MQIRLEIDFYNPIRPNNAQKDFTLSWVLVNNEVSLIWQRLLFQSLSKDLPFYARFTGFENSPKDFQYLSRKMNEAIELINFEGYYPLIKERADGSFSQDFANVMHHHFELLFGDAKNPSSYYRDSSPMGKSAISLINHCVHDMESLSRAKENPSSARAIIFEVNDRQQFALPKVFFKDFTFDIGFGDICLHYGLVGKTWWEVFLDEDEEIFPEGIRPLDVIGPEFDIHFLPQKIPNKTLEKFYQFLRDQGQDPDDPELRLGFYRLAKLQIPEGLTKEEVLKEVGSRSGISRIRLYQNDKVWIERDMSLRPSCQEGFLRLNPLQILKAGDQIETHGFPTEAFIVSGCEEGTLLSDTLTKGPIIPGGHAISLVVPKDGKSLRLAPSEKKRGLHAAKEEVIAPGTSLHLMYDGECWYNPLRKPNRN